VPIGQYPNNCTLSLRRVIGRGIIDDKYFPKDFGRHPLRFEVFECGAQ
jgi:hypothetical protein